MRHVMAISTVILSSLALAPAASATEATPPVNHLPESTISQLTEKFDELNVPSDKRGILIQKLEDGKAWNSFDGSAPVSHEEHRSGNAVVTTERFADGSAVRMAVEDSPGTSEDGTNRGVGGSVSNCKVLSPKGGWTRRGDCEVAAELILAMMGFNADYSVTASAGRIDKVYGENVRWLGGQHEEVKLEVDRPVSDGGAPAIAHVSAKGWVGLKWVTPSVTMLTWLKVRGKAWVEHN